MHANKNRTTGLGMLFDAANIGFILLLVCTMIIPLLNVLALSFSSGIASMQPGIVLWPKDFSADGFVTVWSKLKLWSPFLNNVIVTAAGTLAHVFLSSLAGYVLVQPELPGKKAIVSLILLTMVIPGEAVMIPTYVVFRDFGLLNQLSALIVSGLVSGFSILLMRNFFLSVPREMAESARIDGAGDFRIFFTIYLPLSAAGIATVTLFEFVARWNHFTSALLFINDASKYTLQLALKSLIIDSDTTSSTFMITPNVRMAGIVIALIPLIAVYPFVQKYFVKGIMVGANKE
ncbi:carbohydrate ABC transporter permease [Paenibacillus alkalitolerans]|uniref:carbohydrate ABC transporter permease n=1 Tax=Paenibacillus alkalitolerans TaxID=2799335 RepID=UPI0018F69E36|nr:carbohydrate ABC transporter permease [Paenibacillus alkalitolerans]